LDRLLNDTDCHVQSRKKLHELCPDLVHLSNIVDYRKGI
jgi:hypothetical protein